MAPRNVKALSLMVNSTEIRISSQRRGDQIRDLRGKCSERNLTHAAGVHVRDERLHAKDPSRGLIERDLPVAPDHFKAHDRGLGWHSVSS